MPTRLERLLAADEGAEALVLLAAGWTAVEVRTEAGNRRVGILDGHLADLGGGRDPPRLPAAAARGREPHGYLGSS